jgi:hypothetical protein
MDVATAVQNVGRPLQFEMEMYVLRNDEDQPSVCGGGARGR